MRVGDPVIINLDLAQEGISSMACLCCGCDLSQTKREILRAYAEAQWRYGGTTSKLKTICPVCHHAFINPKRNIWIYCNSIMVGDRIYSGACIPMGWIQKLEAEEDGLESLPVVGEGPSVLDE